MIKKHELKVEVKKNKSNNDDFVADYGYGEDDDEEESVDGSVSANTNLQDALANDKKKRDKIAEVN